jgi:hypothetical protein
MVMTTTEKMATKFKIEMSAMNYAKRTLDLVRKHGEGCSDHHFLALLADIKSDHGADAPAILVRLSEIIDEYADKIERLEAYTRLKRAAGVPAGLSDRRAKIWLAKRGLAKWDEVRSVWLFRKLPLIDEQWIEEVTQ